MCDREPITGDNLSSPPPLSRFENSVTRSQLMKLSDRLAGTVLGHQKNRWWGKRRPKRIIMDLDPTHDWTHGQQQVTFLNGYLRAPKALFFRFHE